MEITKTSFGKMVEGLRDDALDQGDGCLERFNKKCEALLPIFLTNTPEELEDEQMETENYDRVKHLKQVSGALIKAEKK
jgi:hypothetical protein